MLFLTKSFLNEVHSYYIPFGIRTDWGREYIMVVKITLLLLLIMHNIRLYAKVSEQERVTHIISLDQAVDMADHYKPNLRAFKYLVESYRVKEKLAWAGYLPKIDFSMQITLLADGQKGFASASTRQFVIQQLLYSFVGPQEQAKLAALNSETALLQELIARNDLRLTVEQAFFEGWVLQQQEMVIKNILQASTAMAEQHSQEYVASLRNKSEWSASIADHASNVARVKAFDDQLRIAGTQLSFLLGYKQEVHLSDASQNRCVLVWEQPRRVKLRSLNYYRQLAQACRPEIKICQKAIALHHQQAYIAKRACLPTATMSAITSQTSSNYDSCFCLTGGYNAVSTTITWPLFDGLVSEFELERARALKMEAVLHKQEMEHLVQSQIDTAYYMLQQSLHELKAEHYRYLRAKAEYELQELKFSCGLITKTTHFQSMSSWQDVQYGWVNKKAEVAVNMQKLLYRCGYPQKNIV